ALPLLAVYRPLRAPICAVLSPLSLHDALPISAVPGPGWRRVRGCGRAGLDVCDPKRLDTLRLEDPLRPGARRRVSSRLGSQTSRSEEHTSELQSRVDLVCRLLLEKKKNHLICY